MVKKVTISTTEHISNKKMLNKLRHPYYHLLRPDFPGFGMLGVFAFMPFFFSHKK